MNPSLWRQSQVIAQGGLYKVVDGLYQVRNNDIGDLTIVEGDDGAGRSSIARQASRAPRQGMDLFREHVSDKPVAAVIYTHTHIDHYGGVKGVVDVADVASGKVPIIAPGTIASFDKFAIGENVVAGNAMSRRADYAFGNLLDLGPTGHRSPAASASGPDPVRPSPTSHRPTPSPRPAPSGTSPGLTFEFLYAPDTEAPEEMHIWIPQLKALTCAENANHRLHNIQTLRGARTRDARNFARYLDETLERWGDEAQVHYGPHTWPVWDNANIVPFIESQRDTYKYIHDQALRLANKGYTPLEAAEVIELPEELGRKWYNRGYHGTLHHDVRAVYTKELGMWDGDPVSLHPHPPVESANGSSTSSAPTRSSRRDSGPSTRPTTAGPSRSCTNSSSPSPTTRPPATCRPTPTSSWATRSRARSGGASTSRRPRNCAKACGTGRVRHRQPGHDPRHADRHPVRLRRRST